jgi:hypothetical protein
VSHQSGPFRLGGVGAIRSGDGPPSQRSQKGIGLDVGARNHCRSARSKRAAPCRVGDAVSSAIPRSGRHRCHRRPNCGCMRPGWWGRQFGRGRRRHDYAYAHTCTTGSEHSKRKRGRISDRNRPRGDRFWSGA